MTIKTRFCTNCESFYTVIPFDSSVICMNSSVDCKNSSVICMNSSVDCKNSSVNCINSSVDCTNSSVNCINSSVNCKNSSIICRKRSEIHQFTHFRPHFRKKKARIRNPRRFCLFADYDRTKMAVSILSNAEMYTCLSKIGVSAAVVCP